MLDPLSLFFDFIAICILIVIVVGGLKLLYALFNPKSTKISNSHSEETDKQLEENSIEDSEADLIMTSDDKDSWVFPPEWEEEDWSIIGH